MKLTIFRDKFAKSWPRFDDGGEAYTVDAGRAFRRTYTTDAHCVAYVSSTPRRLCSDAVGKTDITLGAIIIDVDCPAVHGSSEPAPDEWRRDEAAKVHTFDVAHPGVFAPDSRGGYRLVLAPPEPVEIHDGNDVAAWRRFYRLVLAYLERRFGIVGDAACSDWSRLFRMPHATRDPKAGPEQRATFGDPNHIGIFTFEPSDADVRKVDKVIRARHETTTAEASMGRFGDGLFYWLFKLRGERLPEAPRGGWIVSECPNGAQHTVKSNTYTVVYPPKFGGEIGNVHCMHGHCVDLCARDWLTFFSAGEIEAARERAGIVFDKKKSRAA